MEKIDSGPCPFAAASLAGKMDINQKCSGCGDENTESHLIWGSKKFSCGGET